MIASQLKPAPDPLASLRGLEEAYRNQWLLSTSELAQLLKLSPKTVVLTVSSFLMQGLSSLGLEPESGERWRGRSVRREE
ncbi:hypothetical protein ABN584_27365 [Gloeocapsa sp. BRSZ]